MILKRYGCRRDLRDPRDHEFRLKVPALIHTLPPAVDLRPWYPPIMDQGDLGSCTANAITGALRWQIITMGGVTAGRLGLAFEPVKNPQTGAMIPTATAEPMYAWADQPFKRYAQ